MPISETFLNRSLHVLFSFFLSDDLNYLIITIGYLRWKRNCCSHRLNFSPNSCSGCREPPPAAAARQQPGHAHGLRAACTLHSSPKAQGKSAWVLSGLSSVASHLVQKVPSVPQSNKGMNFYQRYGIAWPHAHQGQAELEAESQGEHAEIQPFPTVLQA